MCPMLPESGRAKAPLLWALPLPAPPAPECMPMPVEPGLSRVGPAPPTVATVRGVRAVIVVTVARDPYPLLIGQPPCPLPSSGSDRLLLPLPPLPAAVGRSVG